MEYEKKRKEILAAMDLNTVKQGELACELRVLQRQFRDLELQEHKGRATMGFKMNPPSGVHK